MIESEKQHAIALLDELIRSALPKVESVEKYGGTLYTLKPGEKEGHFCGVFKFNAHVQLTFAQGASLSDPQSLLEGNGKFRRHLNFRSLDEVDERVVKRFVKASAKL